jgi:hypothetical protein
MTLDKGGSVQHESLRRLRAAKTLISLCEVPNYVELLLQMRLFQAVQHKSLNIILSARYARILSYRGISIENKERKRNIAKISLTMVGILCEGNQ